MTTVRQSGLRKGSSAFPPQQGSYQMTLCSELILLASVLFVSCRARKMKRLLGFCGSDTQWQNLPPSPVLKRKQPLKKKIENFKRRFRNLPVYETIWCFGVCRLVALTVQNLDQACRHHHHHHSSLLNSSI